MGILFDRYVNLILSTTTEQHSFDQYDIDFDVFATSESEPNNAKISIYGLSPAQRGLFNQELKYLELYAGYKQDKTGLIFRASWDPDESTFLHSREGADWKTGIEIADGSKEFNTALINKTYPAGTPLLKVLNDLARSFGVAVINELAGTETFLHAASFCGYSARVMDDLAWAWKFDWSIQHGTVVITEKGEPARGAGVVQILDFNSGLTAEPRAIAIEAKTSGKKAKKGKSKPPLNGYEIQTMMLSTVRPKSILQLQDKGLFQCVDIHYTGNNTTGEYNCNMRVLAL